MLARLSLTYLLFPYLIFCFGWLNSFMATLFCVVLLSGWLQFLRGEVDIPFFTSTPIEKYGLFQRNVFLVILAASMTIFSGAGAFIVQHIDWLKHMAILNALIENPWPVLIHESEVSIGNGFLCYYFAYYLVPALFGKLLGGQAGNIALVVWTFFGVVLTFLWILRLSGRRSVLAVVFWFLLSGMDVIGAFLVGHQWWSMQWWAGFAQFSSNTTLLAWVPQHALPAWLATSILIDQTERRGAISSGGYVVALTSLWSPFVTIGLVPVLLVAAVRVRFTGAFTLLNALIAPLILLVIVLFLKSVNLHDVPFSWMFDVFGLVGGLSYWAKFCLLEFLAYFLVLCYLYSSCSQQDCFLNREWFTTWGVALALPLTLLPLFKIGVYNDLAMRASIPGLFLLWLLILRVRWKCLWRSWRLGVLFMSLAVGIGAVQPVFDFFWVVVNNKYAKNYNQARISDLAPKYQVQYVGSFSSFFSRSMLRNSR